METHRNEKTGQNPIILWANIDGVEFAWQKRHIEMRVYVITNSGAIIRNFAFNMKRT